MKNQYKVVNSSGKQYSANLSYERALRAVEILKAKYGAHFLITYSDFIYQFNPLTGCGRWLPE